MENYLKISTKLISKIITKARREIQNDSIIDINKESEGYVKI